MPNRSLPTVGLLFAAAMWVGGWANRGSAQPAFPGAMRIVQSEPMTVNDATFAAVVQAEWQRPDKVKELGRQSVTQVDLQLFLTNHKKANVAFSTQGIFVVKLFGKDGKEIRLPPGKKGRRSRRAGRAA